MCRYRFWNKFDFNKYAKDKREIALNLFFSQPSMTSKSTIWAESNSQQLENSNRKLECWLSIYVSSFFYSRRRFSPRVAFKTLCHPLYSNVFAQGSKKEKKRKKPTIINVCSTSVCGTWKAEINIFCLLLGLSISFPRPFQGSVLEMFKLYLEF